MKTVIKQKDNHYLLQDSDAQYFPFVVCRNYSTESNEWRCGCYYRDIDDALKDFNEKYSMIIRF